MDNFSFKTIKDLNIPELDIYRKYNENQLRKIYEPESGLFICESSKVINRALKAGYEMVSVLTAVDKPDEETRMVYDACKKQGCRGESVPIYYGEDEVLKELAGYALTGGVLAAMRRRPLLSIEEIIKDKKVVAVLENINNPTNIGAIFRSAAAMNIEAVILTHDSTDPLYRRAERVSMGTVFQVPWTRACRDEDYLSVLNQNGFKTVAMALSDEAVSISDRRIKSEEKLAIVLGNEGYGLKEETINNSDYVAMIPMNPIVDSLNVAAASAVMFWELRK